MEGVEKRLSRHSAMLDKLVEGAEISAGSLRLISATLKRMQSRLDEIEKILELRTKDDL